MIESELNSEPCSPSFDLYQAKVTDPNAPHQNANYLFCDGPELEPYLREMGAVFAKYDAGTVGEFPGSALERSVRATSQKDPQMSMNFHFATCDFGRDLEHDMYQLVAPEKRRLSQFKKIISDLQRHTEGTDSWLTFFLENHDIARSISRYANDAPEWRVASGKMLACLNASASGTLFLYQGQEIGQINFSPQWADEEYKDVGSINYLNLVKSMGGDLKKAHSGLAKLARDHARTPVQWDGSKPHAGFTSGGAAPWMRVADEYKEINVADQDKDPKSVLNFYRKAIALRTEYLDIFGHGLFRMTDDENDDTFVFAKIGDKAQKRVAVVALNFTTDSKKFSLPSEAEGKELTLLLGSYVDAGEQGTLRPLEGRIYLAA